MKTQEMGICQSKKKRPIPNLTTELEKTLQQCIYEKDEYKEKYEGNMRKYEDIKCQLEKSLQTVKNLQRQLKLSEDNAASLYRRYAIESDLNKRLKQKELPQCIRKDTLSWKYAGNTISYDICERLNNLETRVYDIELILKETESYSNLIS